jgi:hypothetical protein
VKGPILPFSEALSHMDCVNFESLVHAEAEDSHVKIATEAAISRLLPIMDGPDLWTSIFESRSSSVSRGRSSTSLRLLVP